ncbi:DUF3306 domain-containing protein [Vibrio hibernica]|uniref:DUF3306 domain-containing protein n=1 Tax=Vibrio hibernica TaxID=2587465 RepID=UPI0039AF74D0
MAQVVQMESNRFQRWLTKKNQQHQGKAETIESELELALSTEANSEASVDEECIDDTNGPDDIETVFTEALPVDQELNEEVLVQSSNVDSSIATLAHVFEKGFAKGDKKKQLRDLFLGGDFSDIDPLDSYNMDYNAVKSLSQGVASTLRRWHQRIDDVLEMDDSSNEPLNDQATNELLESDEAKDDLCVEQDAEKWMESAEKMEDQANVPSLTDEKYEQEKNSHDDVTVTDESVIDNSNKKPTKLPISD